MRYLFGFMCVCALGAIPLIGCSDESSGGTGGTGGIEPSTFTNTATVNEFDPTGGDPTPISGVMVCEMDTNNCATTDDNGQATMDLPRNVESAVTFVHEDYLSVIIPFDSDTIGDATTTTAMGTNALVQTFLDLLMSPFPTNTGVTSIIATEEGAGTDGANAPLAGVTYELITGSGLPYFVNDSTLPDSSLTETHAPGWGGFYEMPAGTVEVRYGGTATNCTRTFAWDGSASNQLRMPVRAGFQTQAFFLCQGGGSVIEAIEEMLVGRWWLDWDKAGVAATVDGNGLPTFTADGWANYDVRFPNIAGITDWCRRYADWSLFDVVSETEFGYALTYTQDTCNREAGWTEEFKVVLNQMNPPKGEVTRLASPEPEIGAEITAPIERCTTDIDATEACTFDTGLGAPTQNP